ncbi:MAG: PT domain-containing protein [Chloroflexia bacterium]|nr:PT domain-containing protein [Chloroflexia bacterium]
MTFFTAPDYQGFAEVTGAETLGDESTIVTFDVAGTEDTGYLLRMRAGDRGLVASARMTGGGLTLDDFLGVVGPQVACVEAGRCNAAAGSSAEPSDEPIVEPTAEPIAQPTAEPTAVVATASYVSPSFGYTLAYDPVQWIIVEGPTSAEGIDSIGLESGFTTVYLSGFVGALDAPTCVQILADTQTAEANVIAFEPLLDTAGFPIGGSDGGDAFAATRITRSTADGGTIDQAFYARCISLSASGATLAIQQFAAAIIYDSAATQREELLQGLILP